jgi:uncharacterized repeat protein (TIGR02543 family)
MPGKNKWLAVLMLVLLSASCGDDGTYTISFDANGGSGDLPRDVKVLAGEYTPLPSAPGLSRNNYRFVGWNTERVNSGSEGGRYNVGAYYLVPSQNVVMYADWTEEATSIYTVTFNSNGGESLRPQQVAAGRTVNEPPNPTRGDYVFGGWYSDSAFSAAYNFATPVTGDITLYAWWIIGGSGLDSITGLANKVAWLQANAQSNTDYVLEVNADENINDTLSLYFTPRSNITITLRGSGGNRTISHPSGSYLFVVNSSVTLVLDSNITLQGHGDSLITLYWGGMLIMNTGAKITGAGNRTSTNNPGSAVSVADDGSFTMNGGEISGNNGSSNAAGVTVGNNGRFTMNGGKISGNTSDDSGGGVAVQQQNGSFTMTGGEISGNTSLKPGYDGSGGGVFVQGASFTMTGGRISGNTSEQAGGGVAVYSGSGSFTMTGGEISGNTTKGGDDSFGRGGGVLAEYAVFSKTGGTIYGNDAGGSSNVVNGNYAYGHAVYYSNTGDNGYRDATAGPEVNLDTRTDENWMKTF